MEALLTWENGFTVGLWLLIGAAVAWGRNLRLAFVVPVAVTALPTLVVFTAEGVSIGGSMQTTDLIRIVGLPLLGSVIGAYAGIAIAPARRTRKAAHTAYAQAKREAERLNQEIHRMRVELTVPAPIEISSPEPVAIAAPRAMTQGRPVLYDVKAVRTRLAMQEDRLRAIGRALTEAG